MSDNIRTQIEALKAQILNLSTVLNGIPQETLPDYWQGQGWMPIVLPPATTVKAKRHNYAFRESISVLAISQHIDNSILSDPPLDLAQIDKSQSRLVNFFSKPDDGYVRVRFCVYLHRRR